MKITTDEQGQGIKMVARCTLMCLKSNELLFCDADLKAAEDPRTTGIQTIC